LTIGEDLVDTGSGEDLVNTGSSDNAVALRVALAAARTAPTQPGRASALLLEHGSLELRYYAPRGTDPQLPHTRDELYVIASGRGWFVRRDERVAFEPGDVLFVAAGIEHRFEDFTSDFGTWVVFYGPEGGESDPGASR
jgi:mannose-6-phosphate isomerase-like protein (cupin superfamily)